MNGREGAVLGWPGRVREGTLRVVTGRVTVAGLVLSLLCLSTPLLAQYPTTPPPPMPLRPLRFPPFVTGRLANGMNLIIVAQHAQPVVTVTLAMQAGSVYDPPDQAGLASLVAELLTKGTTDRTADQIAAEVEGAGGSIGAEADDDFLRVTISALADNLPRTMAMLADVVEHPTFPASELELARTRELSALQLALSEPGAVADRIFRRAVYGTHPYGRSATPATIRAVTRDDVLAFARAHVRPGRALLVVAGDVQPAQVRRLAAGDFASWHGATTPPVLPAVAELPRREIILVNKPGSVQSNILAGFPFISPGDPAVYPLTVMNQVLGGGTDSRLFAILRERKGWTYGAYSHFTHPRGVGTFVANAEVRTAVTDSAVAELLHQLERIRTQPPADSEITAAKDYLVGSFPLTIQTPEQIANAVASARLRGLPDDYVPKFRDRLAAVTDSALAAADRRYLTPDHMAVVVVGDGRAILPGLKALGPVTIEDVEGQPMTEEDLAPAPTPVAWGADRIVPGSAAYRVLIQGNALGQATQAIERSTEGSRPVLRFTSTTSLGTFAQEADTVVIDAGSMAPIRVRQSGKTGGQDESVVLDYDGTRVKGHVHVPRRTGVRDADVDTTLAAGTLDAQEVPALLPALPLAAAHRWVLSAYSARDGSVQSLSFNVEGDTSVTVPAGTFDCWKVRATGGQIPMIFYVTRAAPYLVAKYELVGPPVSYELTSHTP
jgi:zinc protease